MSPWLSQGRSESLLCAVCGRVRMVRCGTRPLQVFLPKFKFYCKWQRDFTHLSGSNSLRIRDILVFVVAHLLLGPPAGHISLCNNSGRVADGLLKYCPHHPSKLLTEDELVHFTQMGFCHGEHTCQSTHRTSAQIAPTTRSNGRDGVGPNAAGYPASENEK